MDWTEQQARFGALIQPKAEQKPQKKKKNFFVDQISTAGGILGGIGGSFVTPIAGTAAGAGVGSALGEALENLITGNKITDNVVKEGALGAVFGAGPMKLLKGAGGGAKALMSGADDVVGAASRAAMTPLRQTAGKALTSAADDLAVKNFRLNKTQLTNLNKSLGEDAGQFIRRHGFTSSDDIVSKGIEPLQQQFDSIVSGIGSVPKDTVRKQLGAVINPLKKSVSLQEQQLGKSLQSQADEFLKKTGDTLSGSQLLKFRQLFDDGVKYTMKGTPEFNVSKGMADALRKSLQESADKMGLKAADGRSLKDLGLDIKRMIDLNDVVKPNENLGRGSAPFNLLTLLGGAAGGVGGGPAGALGMGVGTAVVNSPAGRKALMQGANATGKALTGSGANIAGQTAKGIAGRQIAQNLMIPRQQPESLEDALVNQDFLSTNSIQNAPNTIPNTMNPMNPNIDGSYQQTQQPSSPYGKANLLADIQRDPKNADKYMEYYAMMDEIFNPKIEEPKALSQGQQERADLITALDNTENLMAGGSINYGPIGSRIESLKSVFNAADPETLAFKNTVSGLRAAITKARAGASLTPGELKMLAQYTPSDTDSEQVVRSKLQQLRALYGYSAPQGGGNSLEDALMQMQGVR